MHHAGGSGKARETGAELHQTGWACGDKDLRPGRAEILKLSVENLERQVGVLKGKRARASATPGGLLHLDVLDGQPRKHGAGE
jgi:hypothetical protein